MCGVADFEALNTCLNRLATLSIIGGVSCTVWSLKNFRLFIKSQIEELKKARSDPFVAKDKEVICESGRVE